MSFVGGKLKLKGGEVVKAGGKKKKRPKTTGDELVAIGIDDAKDKGSQQQRQQEEPGVLARTSEGVVLDPAAQATQDRRTEAEKKYEAHTLRYAELRAKKDASKSHRERIKELNDKLATMTEHHDIFRISYTA